MEVVDGKKPLCQCRGDRIGRAIMWLFIFGIGGSFHRNTHPSTNFQLAFWRDAKKKYNAIDPVAGAPPEEYVLIVGSLVLSLTFLFGRNYSLKDWTPNLWELAEDLKTSDTKLYDRFLDLANFFARNIRHVNSRRVEKVLVPIDYAKVKEWMKTAQDVWLWYIKWYYVKYGDGKVPEEQYNEFQESF